MKFLRWAGASLLGLVGTLLAIVGGLLIGTLVLAPVGIPLLLLAWWSLRVSARLVVPRAVRHPVDELGRAGADVVAAAEKGAAKAARRPPAARTRAHGKGQKTRRAGSRS